MSGNTLKKESMNKEIQEAISRIVVKIGTADNAINPMADLNAAMAVKTLIDALGQLLVIKGVQ